MNKHIQFPRRRRRAFTLVELLVVLLLLAAFSVLYADAVTLAMRAGRDARARDDLIHRVDNAVDTLRRDVWSATALRANGKNLEIQSPTAPPSTIHWTAAEDGTLTRTPPGPDANTHTWPGLTGITFTSTGPLLTLHIADTHGEEQATFVSQQLLMGAKP